MICCVTLYDVLLCWCCDFVCVSLHVLVRFVFVFVFVCVVFSVLFVCACRVCGGVSVFVCCRCDC